MARKRAKVNRTLALTRVNLLLGRIFSIAAPIIGWQMAVNGVDQFFDNNLNPFWFWLTWSLLVGSYAFMSFSIWVFGEATWAYRILALSTIFALLTWGFEIESQSLNSLERPWLWWGVAVAALAAVGGFSFLVGGAIVVLIPILWYVIQISELGIPLSPIVAFRDSLFTFLATATIGTLVALVRFEAAKTDAAHYQASQAAISLTESKSASRERDRIDALVHDTVLTALLVAAEAEDKSSQQQAKNLASNAIDRLELLRDGETVSGQGASSINSLFRSLTEAINRVSNQVIVTTSGSSDFMLPNEVASAVTESTLQAVSNALQHAGKLAEVSVFLRGSETSLKVVVRDNGRGFRPARVLKNSLGLRLSVIERMKSVSGRVFIDSKIGSGTNLIIEWRAP